jgi:hypothetical protein
MNEFSQKAVNWNDATRLHLDLTDQIGYILAPIVKPEAFGSTITCATVLLLLSL